MGEPFEHEIPAIARPGAVSWSEVKQRHIKEKKPGDGSHEAKEAYDVGLPGISEPSNDLREEPV
jgi:hypothetical protein